jgi:hypothetical protein
MSKIMKNNRKNEHKKLIKLVSEQEKLIRMLSDYYVRTDDITRDVQDEMFPETEIIPCKCRNEECDELVYPIHQFIQHHQYVSENFDSLKVEQINISLEEVCIRNDTEETRQVSEIRPLILLKSVPSKDLVNSNNKKH